MHAAVVDEPQRAVAALGEQGVDLAGVDEPAEEVRHLAVAVPRVVVLQPPGVVLQQQRGRAGGLDLLVDRAAVAGHEVAGQPDLLAVEHEAGAGLEDVGGLGEQARVLAHRPLAAAGHEHDLGAGAVAGLQRADALQRELLVGVAQQRAARSQQGAVEVDVERAHAPILANGGLAAACRDRRLAAGAPCRAPPGAPFTRCSRPARVAWASRREGERRGQRGPSRGDEPAWESL